MMLPICPPYQIPLETVLTCGVFRYFPPMEALGDDGRPLLEGRSLRWQLETKNYRTCRYPGQRRSHERPMNVGALQQFMASRHQVLSYLRGLSHAVAACFGPMDPLHLTLRVSHAAYHAPKPIMLATATAKPPNRVEATAAKLGHGVYEGCLGAVMQARLVPADATPAAIADHAEASGQLIGRKEVCAGPRHLMIEVISAMQAGHDGSPSPHDTSYTASVTLAQHIWLAETLAHGNAYAALAQRARETEDRSFDTLLAQARITFPNALESVRAVADARAPCDGFIRAYTQKAAHYQNIRGVLLPALDMAQHVLCLPPDSPDLEAAGGMLRRMSLPAFASLDEAIVATGLAPTGVVAMTPSLLDAFFGSYETPDSATARPQQEVMT
ncbi:hypothetical protein [Phaeobacter sp.]|uniref:hypothetical protein n=1 Tax=Phaeobacter sp. TaxID=1902409 RepID=UPI0025FED5E9|nr:hypothetical protein [Phaeobacter sp.]